MYRVKQIIEEVFNLPLKSNIDGNMGAALGASILAVNLT